jgi:glucosamine-6-phosphate deaminase
VESAGGLDLAILGVGPPPKAHLCFNDAPCLPTDNSRVVTLPEETLDSNGIYWGGRHRVPPQAMTAGMRQLLASKEILVIISGAKKRSCLYSMCLGPVTKDVTASYLQLHDNVTVIADRAAAGSLADGFWPRV